MATDPTVAPQTPEPAGDPIPPAMRQRLQQCYQHGTKLMEKEKYDFDYANSLLSECVVRDPNNLMYVEAFLTNLDRKYDGNKRGSRLSMLGGGKSGFKKAYSKKNWGEVLKLGPDVLKSNPWEVSALRAMAEACEALDYREVD